MRSQPEAWLVAWLGLEIKILSLIYALNNKAPHAVKKSNFVTILRRREASCFV